MISAPKTSGWILALAFAGLGCTGNIDRGGRSGGPDDPGSEPAGGGKPGSGMNGGGMTGGGMTGAGDPKPGPDGVIDSAGSYPLRRLTLIEYSNTIRDLLGVTLSDTDRRGFSADQVVSGGFGSGAALVTSTDSRQFLDVSTKVAAAATADLSKLMPAGCAAPAAGAEEGCINKFVQDLGLRAFRRPLNATEVSGFTALYTKLRGTAVGAPFGEAVHDVLLAILQAPEFLYRWELDGAPVKDGSLIKFGPYEVASRLSYFLWASMPDDALFQAAKTGGLNTPDQIAAQAERMLKDEKARDGLRDFHMQWLGMYGVDELEKDPSFATYSPEVAKAMLTETSTFLDANLFGPQASGKLETLLTSTTSYVNAALAKHYGLSGITGDTFQKVELNPAQRSGILTQGAYLASRSKEVDSFPIGRGLNVLRQVLCQEIPEPTIMLPPPPEQKMGVTTRQLYEDFTKAVACQACHNRINGVGFAFENYDAAGGFRDKEEGQAVDSSGTLELPSGTITFKNGIEFIKAIAKTPEVRDCFARNWMRQLLRRQEVDLEGGSVKQIEQAFEASQWDVRKLLVSVTKTRAFTHRNPVAKAGN
jgi:hypothetical protein